MTILQLSELMGLILVGGFVGSFATWLRMTWEKPEPHPLADEPEKTEISYLKTIASRLMSTDQTETRRWEDLGQALEDLKRTNGLIHQQNENLLEDHGEQNTQLHLLAAQMKGGFDGVAVLLAPAKKGKRKKKA